jgi:beta-lactamase superfamily II metal-dependent hydrolase
MATFQFGIRLICAIGLVLAFTPEPTRAAGICGSGTWTSGNLEIHHINIGQGDSTLIVGPTGKSLLFDAGESTWNSSTKARIIGLYIENVLGCKTLDYVVVSHFHLDHIGYVGYGGLWHLVEIQGFTVGTTLLRDYNDYLGDISGTFTNWKMYLEGSGQTKLHPDTAIEGTGQVNLGAGVIFNIVAISGNGALIPGNFQGDSSPPSENDYSIGAVLSYGDFDEWIGGDLSGEYDISGFGYSYHDIELSVAPEVGDVDVYRVNHHGSAHSSNASFIGQLDPEVSIVTVGNKNTYGHPDQTTMDRLLATSTVYMTERGDTDTDIGSAIVAGNIVIKTSDGLTYTVNGTAFTASEPIRIDMDGDGYFVEVDPNDNIFNIAPSLNGGCDPIYQTCSTSCQATAGQVLINEVLPSPSNVTEWVELYNTTASTINIGYCYIDDMAGGSFAYQIPASTLIPSHGFWTLDRTSYFNNAGDEVRFLKEDASTLLDSFTYGNTGSNLSWHRFPDGGSWALSPTASTTKGQSNTIPFYPIVTSIVRADENPTDAGTVNFNVTFSKAVTGVDKNTPFNDFALTNTGVTGAYISAVTGSGISYTITVNTGSGSGTIRLDIIDDDSIKDASNQSLGGAGAGNGSFTGGEVYTVNRASVGNWFIRGIGSFLHGTSTDIPVPADYNGDGKDDLAIFRESNSTWYLYGVGPFVYGTTNDIPVIADYNGDGKADIAVFRQSNSTWYIYGVGPFQYGTVGDVPVVADYNGDGKDDIAVFRESNSTWYIYGVGPSVYGTVGDIPVVGDYNGDGKADIAVFRPSNSTWYIRGVGPLQYGQSGDIPVIGDYNGDGKDDIAVFRPSNSTWYIRGVGPALFGTTGDTPVVADYNGDGRADIAVFRP